MVSGNETGGTFLVVQWLRICLANKKKIVACNAGDTALIPRGGTKILHASGQLNPRATATEPVQQLENLWTMKDPTLCT